MAKENSGEIQTQDSSKSGPRLPEQTRPGPVYSPAVDIFERESAITVLADMPGVQARDLEIDLRENVLTLTGRVSPPETEGPSSVLREYQPGTFFRQFTLGSTIEQSKIEAKLTDGVLRLELPKAEKNRPRQITVRAE
jgi:HSP20 family molecular chaperone IbpA